MFYEIYEVYLELFYIFIQALFLDYIFISFPLLSLATVFLYSCIILNKVIDWLLSHRFVFFFVIFLYYQ